jgi:hypothetical protein
MGRPSEAELRRGEAATWGPGPGAAAQRPRMRLLSWKPITKGSLRGFATVELPIGLRLVDCGVFVGTKGAWAALPAKPQLDKENRQRLGADGKPSYSPVVEWRSRDLADRFSAAVVALVRAAHPDALGGGAP